MDWVSYKFTWASSIYQVSLPLGQGKELCDEIAIMHKVDIEFVWLSAEPKYYNKKG